MAPQRKARFKRSITFEFVDKQSFADNLVGWLWVHPGPPWSTFGGAVRQGLFSLQTIDLSFFLSS